MKKICKHCEGSGKISGPLGSASCQPCDGAGWMPIMLPLIVEHKTLSLKDKQKPTHKR